MFRIIRMSFVLYYRISRDHQKRSYAVINLFRHHLNQFQFIHTLHFTHRIHQRTDASFIQFESRSSWWSLICAYASFLWVWYKRRERDCIFFHSFYWHQSPLPKHAYIIQKSKVVLFADLSVLGILFIQLLKNRNKTFEVIHEWAGEDQLVDGVLVESIQHWKNAELLLNLRQVVIVNTAQCTQGLWIKHRK